MDGTTTCVEGKRQSPTLMALTVFNPHVSLHALLSPLASDSSQASACD